MEDLICNQGLSLIAEDIFSLADISDLLVCQQVCQSWQNFLKKTKKIWVKSFQRSKLDFQSIQKLDKNTIYGELWLETIIGIEKNGDIQDIIELSQMFNFVETLYPAEDLNLISPLDFICSYGSVNMFKVLLKYGKVEFQDDCIQILISAVTTGNEELVQHIATKIQNVEHFPEDLRSLLQVGTYSLIFAKLFTYLLIQHFRYPKLFGRPK